MYVDVGITSKEQIIASAPTLQSISDIKVCICLLLHFATFVASCSRLRCRACSRRRAFASISVHARVHCVYTICYPELLHCHRLRT